MQNSFFNDHKKDRGWVLRSETQAVIRRESQCVFSEWSDLLGVEKRLHKLFKEKSSLHFRLPGVDCLLCQEVVAVKKDVTVQATAVYNHGLLALLILSGVTGVDWQQSNANLATLAKDASYS